VRSSGTGARRRSGFNRRRNEDSRVACWVHPTGRPRRSTPRIVHEGVADTPGFHAPARMSLHADAVVSSVAIPRSLAVIDSRRLARFGAGVKQALGSVLPVPGRGLGVHVREWGRAGRAEADA
jgi:hypothetical protein